MIQNIMSTRRSKFKYKAKRDREFYINRDGPVVSGNINAAELRKQCKHSVMKYYAMRQMFCR